MTSTPSTPAVGLKPETCEQAVVRMGRVSGFAPGNYTCTCRICDRQFEGDKRAIFCLPCAVANTRPVPAPAAEGVEHWKARADAAEARIKTLEDHLRAIAGWEDVSSAEWDRAFPQWNERFKRLNAHFGNETLAFLGLAIEIARAALSPDQTEAL